MNINLQYRDEQGNLVKLTPHQPLTPNELMTEIATAGLIVAMVVIFCLVLI
jgi:hypothetical protein